MSEESIKTIHLFPDGHVFEVASNGSQQLLVGQTNWEQIRAMTDPEIEALALSDSENPPLSETELQALTTIPDVKKIRTLLQLSQKQFAQKFHLSLKTIQDWEQGRTQPDQASRTLLKVISVNPEAVAQALTS